MNNTSQVDIEIISSKQRKDYYGNVIRDLLELKKEYPFCFLTIPPTKFPSIASIHVIAASKSIIDRCYASEEDFLGDYSKELYLEIPYDYTTKGCNVYGGAWIDSKKIPYSQRHFYPENTVSFSYGYKFCVGVPKSFIGMKNVILENVRTAEHLLIAYENYLCGNNREIIVNEYSHGDRGIREYAKHKNKLRGRRRSRDK